MSFLDSMVVRGTCPNLSHIKQLRVHHAYQQSSFCFPGVTNVGHEPKQVSSTLDGFFRCDPKMFAEAEPSIQLYSQVPEGSPVRD